METGWHTDWGYRVFYDESWYVDSRNTDYNELQSYKIFPKFDDGDPDVRIEFCQLITQKLILKKKTFSVMNALFL